MPEACCALCVGFFIGGLAIPTEQRKIIEGALLAQQKLVDSACLIHQQHREPDEAVVSLEVLDELKQVSKALQELLDEEEP